MADRTDGKGRIHFLLWAALAKARPLYVKHVFQLLHASFVWYCFRPSQPTQFLAVVLWIWWKHLLKCWCGNKGRGGRWIGSLMSVWQDLNKLHRIIQSCPGSCQAWEKGPWGWGTQPHGVLDGCTTEGIESPFLSDCGKQNPHVSCLSSLSHGALYTATRACILPNSLTCSGCLWLFPRLPLTCLYLVIFLLSAFSMERQIPILVLYGWICHSFSCSSCDALLKLLMGTQSSPFIYRDHNWNLHSFFFFNFVTLY